MIAPLARIVEALKGQPSRTGSLIVTFHGDAILPRGGSVWLGTLLTFLDLIEIDGGSVRTAVSRLTGDGWLDRDKIGRKSFYRLAEAGRMRFAAAMQHVYDAPASDWDGRLALYLFGAGADRDAARSRFADAGCGSPLPGVWIAPPGGPRPDVTPDIVHLTVSADAEEGRRLVAESWPLARTAEAYRHFLQTFVPLRRRVGGAALAPADAILARVLMVHHYRRIVLRDPLLPAPLLPRDWPGRDARALCTEIYPRLLAASEAWLDRFGESRGGPLPPADASLAGRFTVSGPR